MNIIIYYLDKKIQIQESNQISDNQLFKNLEDIQFVLAKSVFKNGIEVTPFLRRFIYDFDRIDDKEIKSILYDRIKAEASK